MDPMKLDAAMGNRVFIFKKIVLLDFRKGGKDGQWWVREMREKSHSKWRRVRKS